MYLCVSLVNTVHHGRTPTEWEGSTVGHSQWSAEMLCLFVSAVRFTGFPPPVTRVAVILTARSQNHDRLCRLPQHKRALRAYRLSIVG